MIEVKVSGEGAEIIAVMFHNHLSREGIGSQIWNEGSETPLMKSLATPIARITIEAPKVRK
jgi:hypothetical protein